MPLLSLKERNFSCWEGELFSRLKHWQQGGAHGVRSSFSSVVLKIF